MNNIMDSQWFESLLESIIRPEMGESIIDTPSASACAEVVSQRYPSSKSQFIDWSVVDNHFESHFDDPEQVSKVTSFVLASARSNGNKYILVVPDMHTDKIAQISVDRVIDMLPLIKRMPAGFLLGPSSWDWIVDLRMSGSAYYGHAIRQ